MTQFTWNHSGSYHGFFFHKTCMKVLIVANTEDKKYDQEPLIYSSVLFKEEHSLVYMFWEQKIV